MPEGVKWSLISFAGYFVLMLASFIHQDFWLWVFSLMVFYACGVPWELQHWRKGQEFMNGSKEKG